MRVKLSYTVDEEDVLKEAAKILSLAVRGHAVRPLKMFQHAQVTTEGRLGPT